MGSYKGCNGLYWGVDVVQGISYGTIVGALTGRGSELWAPVLKVAWNGIITDI